MISSSSVHGKLPKGWMVARLFQVSQVLLRPVRTHLSLLPRLGLFCSQHHPFQLLTMLQMLGRGCMMGQGIWIQPLYRCPCLLVSLQVLTCFWIRKLCNMVLRILEQVSCKSLLLVQRLLRGLWRVLVDRLWSTLPHLRALPHHLGRRKRFAVFK